MPRIVNGISEILSLEGSDLGDSPWIEVTQEMVNTFADATGDHQWIHVDTERAKSGPFGATIAHGLLTISLLSRLWDELLDVRDVAMGVHYGLNKVRFLAPVRTGSKIRAHGVAAAVRQIPGGAEITADITVRVEGDRKPVCAAQAIYRIYG